MIKRLLKWLATLTGIKSLLEKYIEYIVDRRLEMRLRNLLREEEWEAIIQKGELFVDVFITKRNKIRCYTNSLMGKLIYLKNFEQNEITFVTESLKPGDIFIDVGANIGLFSIIASEYVGPNGKIYAFEPDIVTYAHFQENIKLNNLENIIPIVEALSNEDGYAELYSYQNGLGAYNSFAPVLPEEDYTKIEVKQRKGDTFINQLSEEEKKLIKLIKIDVEGWEIPVLRGFEHFLKLPNAPMLLVEFTEENARAAGFSCQALFDLGEEYGYKWFKIDERKLTKAKKIDYFGYQNLIAIKDMQK